MPYYNIPKSSTKRAEKLLGKAIPTIMVVIGSPYVYIASSFQRAAPLVRCDFYLMNIILYVAVVELAMLISNRGIAY